MVVPVFSLKKINKRFDYLFERQRDRKREERGRRVGKREGGNLSLLSQAH